MTSRDPRHDALLSTVPLRLGADIAVEPVGYGIAGEPFEGVLAADRSTDERRPGVLLVHDWTGVGEYVATRAEMAARLGFVAFACDVYGAGIRPQGDAAAQEAGRYYADLPLLRARVRAGLDRLLADPRVDPERVVVLGYCFGGTAAIELARSGAALRGAISIHGSLVTHEAGDSGDIRCPLLILTGGADPVVPDERVAAFQHELRATDASWEVVTYSGAPHAFTLPTLPVYRELADRRAWRRIVDFLDEVFAD